MKSAMILCALATVCCFSTGNAADNRGTALLTNLKSTIQSAKDDLIRYRKDLDDNTRSKLNDLKIVELTTIDSITNAALAAIQSEVDQAKAVGKNADHCFELLRQRIRLASLNSVKVLDKCASDALATIDPIKKDIDILLPLDNHVISELDTLAINCTSSDAMATQNCIIAQVTAARAKFAAYDNTAHLMMYRGDRASSDAQISGQRCYQTGVQTVRDESNSARSDAHQCPKS